MRPLRLELKGFTAFRDATELDLEPLEVFAISGPTGSGKSSLLDAITYALYGRVERVGDRVGQLVSQGQPSMAVTLEFEVGRDRYRVTRRTPSGRGATKVLLERLKDGAWAQAGSLSLEREYGDVSAEALDEARRAAEEAASREGTLTVASRAVAEVVTRWRESERWADELRACADEAIEAASAAREAGDALR